MRTKPDEYEKALFTIETKILSGVIPATSDMDIATKAIKKQIGQKVAFGKRYESNRCPCCNAVVNPSEHYCSQCGQKLDWRVYNDI